MLTVNNRQLQALAATIMDRLARDVARALRGSPLASHDTLHGLLTDQRSNDLIRRSMERGMALGLTDVGDLKAFCMIELLALATGRPAPAAFFARTTGARLAARLRAVIAPLEGDA